MRFYAPATACRMLGISDTTLRRLVNKHLDDGDFTRIPSPRGPRKLFITETGLEKLYKLLDKNPDEDQNVVSDGLRNSDPGSAGQLLTQVSLPQLSNKIAIRIANPEPGGKKYTSGKRAMQFVRSGRAILTDEGELFFLSRAEYHAHQQRGLISSVYSWARRESGQTLGGNGMRVFQATSSTPKETRKVGYGARPGRGQDPIEYLAEPDRCGGASMKRRTFFGAFVAFVLGLFGWKAEEQGGEHLYELTGTDLVEIDSSGSVASDQRPELTVNKLAEPVQRIVDEARRDQMAAMVQEELSGVNHYYFFRDYSRIAAKTVPQLET